MISKERMEELEDYFWSETNEEDTQEWREHLNAKEEELVTKWDEKYSNGVLTLFKEF